MSAIELRIDEHLLTDGRTAATFIVPIGPDSFGVAFDGDAPVELALDVLDRVMARYGKPLADDVAVDGPTLLLGGGRSLTMIRHLARYDVIARDYLVMSRPGEPPVTELATSISAALLFLAKRAAPPKGVER